MKTINRTVLTVYPKQPYIEWANSFNDGGPTLDPTRLHPTAILIPDSYDEFNYEEFLQKKYKIIFELELEAWMASPEHWPKNRNYKVFNQWFEVRVADTVIDLGSGKIVFEEY